ncbi:MAG: BamA/TamA family outer membrane protein [Candidatus Eisenbacteria sp.]|nr:BamA/TamA family outer membrane protein [Candidatus Eisenbacteria bacterium]
MPSSDQAFRTHPDDANAQEAPAAHGGASSPEDPAAHGGAGNLADTADPGGARGYEVASPRAGEQSARVIRQIVLFPARATIHVATLPVSVLTGWMSPAGLIDRAARGFRNDKYLIPVAFVDPDLGVNAGFRAGHLNPLHRGSCVTYRAAWGGTKDYVFAVTLRSRKPYKLGWSYRLTGKCEIIPDRNYFGIGNLTTRDHWTHYTQERYLLLAKLGWAPTRWMRWDFAMSTHRNQISRAAYLEEGQNSIEDIWHSESIAPGLWLDPQNYWGETALTLDWRNCPGRPTSGLWGEAFFGWAKGTGDDSIDYARYGGEVQGYIPLGGQRVFVLRLSGEEARTAYADPIKFTELPSLGGRSTLRGYLEDRFMDNAAILATAEYRYRIAPFAEACLFADFGKVMFRLLDFDFDDVHRSWGGGLRFATSERFLFRTQVAGSDEDIVCWVTLESAFDREDRRNRR